MSTSTEFEAAFAAGASINIVTQEIEGIEHALVPPGCELRSLEKLMPKPMRIRATPEFYDVAGFVDYAAEFQQEGTRIFVEDSSFRFFTIFDFHAKDTPAWGDHSASLCMTPSAEWTRFKSIDGVKMAPMELAEFLEENLTYIAGPVEGADLLTMAQNLKVTLKGNLDVEHSTQAGMRHLQIKDDSTLAGRSGKKEIAFPEKVELALRIFDNHSTYPIKAFLRYRANKDGVTFWFKIPDPQGIEREAFETVVKEVRETTGLKTLKGRFRGPSHK